MLTTSAILTTADAARRLGVAAWKVSRLFERGLLPRRPDGPLPHCYG